MKWDVKDKILNVQLVGIACQKLTKRNMKPKSIKNNYASTVVLKPKNTFLKVTNYLAPCNLKPVNFVNKKYHIIL